MKMIILTARHHDGFCLWPSKYTDYSVARSNWMNGRGDVVRAVADACRKYGLKFGVYLSPWDRHEPFYGDSPRYNEFFRDQLRELLTNYGEISEVWFDGACGEGPNGKKQVYDWPSYYKVIRELQPNAVIAVMGPDVRWVGTETGNGRETEWSVLPDLLHYPDSISPSNLENITDNNFIPGDLTDSDLGSRDKILNAKNLMWYPAETDVSIRPGWFYHELDDYRVKKPAQLVDIYFNSVGKNSVLLLNIPPDKQGRIHKQDVKSLEETHEILGKAFRNNLVNIDAQKLQESRTAEGYPVFEYSWSQPVSFNMIMLQEDIMKGQRIEKFHIDYWNETEWKTCAGGTTIGYKRLFRFWDTKGSRIRLVIESSRDKPVIKTFGVYHMVMKSEEGER
jgi:alpha-L-fucosidase